MTHPTDRPRSPRTLVRALAFLTFLGLLVGALGLPLQPASADPVHVVDHAAHKVSGSRASSGYVTSARRHPFVKPVEVSPRDVVSVGKRRGGKQQVVLSKHAPHLKNNQVFIVTFSATTPQGLIAKVVSLHRRSSGSVVAQTVRPRLDEVVPNGKHSFKKAITVGRQSVRRYAGVAGVPFTLKGNCNGSVKKFQVDGNFTATMRINGTLSADFWHPERDSIGMTVDYGQMASLRVHLEAAAKCTGSITMLSIEVPFTVVGIPLHPFFTLSVDGTAAADGVLDLNASESISGSAGFLCSGGHGCVGSGSLPSTHADLHLTPVAGSMSAEAGVTGAVGLKIPALAEASINTRLYAGASATVGGNPAWSTYYGARVFGHAAATLIGSADHTFWEKKFDGPSGPKIVTAGITSALAGNPVDQWLRSAGGQGPLTWTVVGGALPAGVQLGSDGHLVGTPTAPGRYDFTVRLADQTGGQVIMPYHLDVKLLTITYSGPRTYFDGGVVKGQLTATGTTGPYTWSLGSASNGWTVTNDGLLTSPPLEGPLSRIVVRATDAAGRSQTSALTFNGLTRCSPKFPDCGEG